MTKTTAGLLAIGVFFATGGATSLPPAITQSAEDEILAVALQLFEAMRTNDGVLAASVFHPEARMGSRTEEGITFVSVDGFVDLVGQPKNEVWDEPIWDYTIQVEGRVAQMWTKYAFYLGDTFSHCGIDSFEFFRTDDGWKITQLVDTRRTENCWLPPGR